MYSKLNLILISELSSRIRIATERIKNDYKPKKKIVNCQEVSKEQSKKACQQLGKIVTEEGITRAAISELTGFTRSNVSRLFSGRYSPSLTIVYTALNAINGLSGKNYGLKDIDLSE